MPAATDYFKKVGLPGNATTLAAPGHTIGGTSFTVVSTSLWPTDTGVTFAVDTTQLVNGVTTRVSGSYTVWDGVVSSGTTITGAILRYGTDQNYPAGSTTRVYILPTSVRENKIVDGLLASGLTQAGGMGAISPTSVTTPLVTATSGVFTNITVGSQTPSADWTASTSPTTVTYNGNRSYDLVFNATDLTGAINPGTRVRTTRTIAAPDQSASLNGTTQYFNKTTPSGMTFTDDFVVGAWVKLTSYGAFTWALSRYNGTSGWELGVNSSGQVTLYGFNAGAANYSNVTSYQSIPLNKWVHVAAQLDMSTFTASTTTSYVMIDGVDVPASVARAGTNPTTLIQAGNLEVGSNNGGTQPWPGKIAQAFVSSAKITQANVRTLISQGLTSALVTANSIVSAYSLSNSLSDINTTNANNLTANGSATTTNADSPFGTQASGLISTTLDYGIVQAAAFSTNTTLTVQVPEGCAIPTSGGITALSYSSVKAPYGFPARSDKWQIATVQRIDNTTSTATINTWYNAPSLTITVPAGSWNYGYQTQGIAQKAGSGNARTVFIVSTTSASATGAISELESSIQIQASDGSNATTIQVISRSNDLALTSPQIYYFNYRSTIASMQTSGIYLGDGGYGKITLTNAYI